MGMCGNYIIADDALVGKITSGEVNIYKIDPDKHPQVDIDKAWEAINFILCGDLGSEPETPLKYVVPLTGEGYLEDVTEFGTFYITPLQAKMVYKEVKDITRDKLKEMYDFDAMAENEVYPITEEEDPEQFFDYVAEHFESIKELYKKAVETDKGVIFYLA